MFVTVVMGFEMLGSGLVVVVLIKFVLDGDWVFVVLGGAMVPVMSSATMVGDPGIFETSLGMA